MELGKERRQVNDDTISDETFMAWCAANKPCRYCSHLFVGPTYPCESGLEPQGRKKRDEEEWRPGRTEDQ